MPSTDLISVSSTIDSNTFLQKASALAGKLGLSFTPDLHNLTAETILAYTQDGLKLLQFPIGTQKPTCLLFVDFVHGKNGFRLAKNCTSKQPIARAVGLKSGFRPTILDGTAGLGADAFVLASLGCQVTLCERSPVLAALLEDGLYRAAEEQNTSGIVERMQLIQQDTRSYLQENTETFHTIYLDPMYPHRKQTALSKQPIRIIRSLVGDDTDTNSLFNAAIEKATNRVVVKRPLKAPFLTKVKPTHAIQMKNSRFDIYLTFHK